MNYFFRQILILKLNTFFFRFVNKEDKEWFEKALRGIIRRRLPREADHYTMETPYFVNFLREPPDATGDEPDDFVFEAPKTYEEIPRFLFFFFCS